MNLSDAIQNLLVSTARNFKFPIVHYRPAPVGSLRCTDPARVASPKSAVAYESQAVFAEPVRNRRNATRRELTGWVWILVVQFDAPVSLEEFHDLLCDSHPVILRDPENGINRQVDLLLDEAEIQTPVQQQPAQGTRVTYRFTAQLSPT